MDGLSLRLLKTQAGRCPCCGDLLLHADHPPQSPSEWEQWVRVTGKALRKQSLAYRKRDGSGETSSLRSDPLPRTRRRHYGRDWRS